MLKTTFQPTGPATIVAGKRHFGRCRSCKTKWVSESTKRVQPGENVQRFLGANGWSDGARYAKTKTLEVILDKPNCPQCGTSGVFKALEATLNENVRCDHRCTSAKGHSCECSCGGANHGIAA